MAQDKVLTNFDQIWQLSEAEQREWHRVRFEYVVYYYDPLWQAMWGRCADADNYLSLGTKIFPIKPGQKILIEGRVQPVNGLRVDDPKVTVLAESVPIEILSTNGQVASTERFNKHVVTIDGYVDHEVTRDANHLEFHAIAEGRPVLVELVLKNDSPIPQLLGTTIRAKGVYFARSDPSWAGPKIEIWVQRNEDIEVLGRLDRDERFAIATTPVNELGNARTGALVHVTGTVETQDAGKSLTLRDGTGVVVVETAQTQAIAAGEKVEVIGYPEREGNDWIIRRSLFREAQTVFTSIEQLWHLSDVDRRKRQRVKLETIVYHYDPEWKALWGRAGGFDSYFSLGDKVFPIKSGQKILVEGSVVPANGMVIDDAKVSVLADSVPLEPLSTRGQIGNTSAFDKRFVVVEGYVDRQIPKDPKHVELDLVVEGRAVVVRLLLDGATDLPKWEGAVLRIKGVYSATNDPTGALPTIEIWTAGPHYIETVGSLEHDSRFEIAATPIEKLSSLTTDTLVRITGVARAQEPGKSLTIRDETGQVQLRTVQTRPVQLGEPVEAIGYPVTAGTEWNLRDGIFRHAQSAPAAPTTGLTKLRLADQLRELQPEEAARGYPVQLSGIVTWARPNADFFFVRDASGGVCVFRPPQITGQLLPGTRVDLVGVTASGKFTPVVLASSVTGVATIEMPDAHPVTLEQALTGVEEAQWVSMTGYVRDVARDGPWTRLDLTTSAGEFSAMLPPNDRWAKLPGSVIRVRGVCSAVANSKRQLTGIQMWVASPRFVEIEEAAPENPFSVATRSIASLRQFGSVQTLNRRVRVSGIVIHDDPGRLVHVQEGSESLLVLSRDPTPVVPGDRIEAVGFPGRENSRVVLREAVYRRIATGPEPAAFKLNDLSSIDAELDGRLVRMEGVLVNVDMQEKGFELVMQAGSVIFEAQIAIRSAVVPDGWVPGSRAALTGVYQIQFDEYRRPHSVHLQLRSPGDVQILQRASWWTLKRALIAIAILAVALVLGFGWVVALRRRVQQQTGLIREQIESEKAARLEAALTRASKLESLGVLAGGIAHDFNNLLTVIMGNLSLAKLDGRIEAETVQCLSESERAASRARDLTQQLLTFAKGGEPMRMSTRLPDVVREAAEFALHGSKVRCEFDIASDLWPADVDKGQIGQVVHNIIINASQAMPHGGHIQIVLRNDEITGNGRSGLAAGRYVKLSCIDTGSGITPENVARIFEPYFTTKSQGSGLGLATVYSIVKKHQGHIEVSSKLNEGTTFHVWVPAATHPPAAAKLDAVAKKPKAGRVLLMDDEAPIRLLGAAVLKRMGLEVTSVNDGAAVVSEYAAAIASDRPYDLVVLDLTVPGGMGGAEAMEKLRSMDSDVWAIVSSGYSSDPIMANYRESGFRGRVPKPYGASELTEVVNAVMSERKKREQ